MKKSLVAMVLLLAVACNTGTETEGVVDSTTVGDTSAIINSMPRGDTGGPGGRGLETSNMPLGTGSTGTGMGTKANNSPQ